MTSIYSSITILDPIATAAEQDLLHKLSDYGLNHLETIAHTGWNYALDQIWLLREIGDYLQRFSPSKPVIVEVGCGKSIFHNFVEEYFGLEVIGIDRPEGFCNPGEFKNVDYFVDFLEFTAFQENSVDIIFWLSSIEHNKLPQIRDLFLKSIGLLREKGMFLATCALSENTGWFEPSEQTNLSVVDCKKLFDATVIKNDFHEIRERYRENILYLRDRYKSRYGHFSNQDPAFIVGGVKASKLPQQNPTSHFTSYHHISPPLNQEPSYNLLFYIEPMKTFHRPLFHLPWWTFAYRKIASLSNDPFHKFSFRVITSGAIKEQIKNQDFAEFLEILEIDDEKLLTYFEGDYLKASLAWYHQTYSEEQISYTSETIKGLLGNWKPDIMISYSPAPFLQRAFPLALLLHCEYGMTSRPPFSESFYFDPLGYYQYSYLSRYDATIRSVKFTEKDYQALEEYRNFFINLIDQRNPFKPLIEELRNRFKHLILVPLQASHNYWFDGNCKFKSQFHMIEWILKNTPQHIGVIFVPHPDFPVFTQDTLNYLRSRYPHFIYNDEFEQFGSVSQYILSSVDAVASVSSMVGLQALIWKKKIIALGESHLNFVADATSLEEIEALLQQPTPNKDNILLWLLSHYYIPLSYVQDPIWFGGFLETALNSFRNKEDPKDFYRQIDAIHHIIHRNIQAANLNIPILKEQNSSNIHHVQLFFSSVNEYREEKSITSTVHLEKWQTYYFSLQFPNGTEEIHLRFDPCNHPALIEVRRIVISSPKTEQVIWKAEELASFSALIVNGTAIKLASAHESLYLFSFGNDPQLIFPEIKCPEGTQDLIVEISMWVSENLEKVSQFITEIVQKLDSNQMLLQKLNNNLMLLQKLEINKNKQFEELTQPISGRDEQLTKLFIAQYGQSVFEDVLVLFDKNWYIRQYPEASANGLSSLWDYLQNCTRDGRNPNPFFDTLWYLEQYPEVEKNKYPPLVHYIIIGAKKGYNPSPKFDTFFYLEMNPEVKHSGMNPLCHYLQFGQKENRQPKPGLIQLGKMSAAEIKMPGFHGYLETSRLDGGMVYLEGWAFHDNLILQSINLIAKTNDDINRYPGRYGWYRGDLESLYSSINAAHSGFAIKAKISPNIKCLLQLEFRFDNDEVVTQPLGYYFDEETEKTFPDQGHSPWSNKGALLRKGRLEDVIPLYKKDLPIKQSLGQTIDIIIPVYKAMTFLPRLFDSLLKNTSEPYRLIIVDDGNKDDETQSFLNEIVRKKPDTILIHHLTNLGFVVSCNDAFQYVRNHFVLLNTDVELPPYWLERLMQPIIDNPKIASTTPFTNSGTVCSFPKFLENNEIFANTTVEKLDEFFSHFDISELQITMPSGVGFCMGMNYEVAKQIGLFDAETFGLGHGEENDWCTRARNAGYINILVPNLFVWHKHGGTWGTKKKSELEARNFKLLGQKHPTYFNDVQEFIQTDPAAPLRDFIVLIAGTHLSGVPPYLFFDHELGGGANYYRNNKIKNLVENGHPVLLLVWKQDEHKLKLRFYFQKYFVEFDISTIDVLIDLISLIPPVNIFINELVSYPNLSEYIDFILELKKSKGCLITLAMHDFYALCPSFNLLNSQNIYCDLPHIITCQQCLPVNNNVLFYWDADIVDWRNMWSRLIQSSDEILCFSHNTASIVLKVYPEISSKINIQPHQVNYLPKKFLELDYSQECHIGVVGGISLPKGSQVVSSIAQIIEKQKLPIKLTIIGTYHGEKLPNWVRVTGHYKRTELPIIIEETGANIFLFPSIWPETFSYVVEELISLNVPIVCFNIGAPAERISQYSLGKIIDKVDAHLALQVIKGFYHEIQKKLKIRV